MRIRIAGVSAWTAAGDVAATTALAEAGGRAFSELPPYDPTGLSNPRCGAAAGLVDRERPAETLLLRVVQEALGDAPRAGTGLIVGTSSGNICGPFEAWHRDHLAGGSMPAEGIGRDTPTEIVAARLGLTGPRTTLSVACVSGTAVLAIAEGWIRDGLCERVVAAGVDALSQYVHAGFSGLGALSADFPQPFTDVRDGLLLGEGAAALLLEAGPAREGEVELLGTGLAADAVHMTAPDREAGGAVRASREALDRAGEPSVHTVSVHGTGTRFNDGMEAIALERLFPAGPPVIQLVKRGIGHTMGAAGAVEAAVAVHTLRDHPGAMLSMSSAFGGMNAAVVVGTGTPREHVERAVTVGERFESGDDLRGAWPDVPLSALRADRYVRTGLTAIHGAHAREALPLGTALVLTSRSNCALVDRVYHQRIVEEGAGHASRRAFAATIPAAPICEASIQLGLQGPLLAFVDGPERGLDEAKRLVRHGRCQVALAIHVEAPSAEGPAVGSCIRVAV